MAIHHFTDKSGYNGIRATREWCFKARQPPADHPVGSYFTTLGPETKNLALRLRVPRSKIEHAFVFTDGGDLLPLRGHRGDFILYSPVDYVVAESRRIASGERSSLAGSSLPES